MWWILFVALARGGECDAALEAWVGDDHLSSLMNQERWSLKHKTLAKLERAGFQIDKAKKQAFQALLAEQTEALDRVTLEAMSAYYRVVLREGVGCEVLTRYTPWHPDSLGLVDGGFHAFYTDEGKQAEGDAAIAAIVDPFVARSIEQTQALIAQPIEPRPAPELAQRCQALKQDLSSFALSNFDPSPGSPGYANLRDGLTAAFVNKGLSQEAVQFGGQDAADRIAPPMTTAARALEAPIATMLDEVVSCNDPDQLARFERDRHALEAALADRLVQSPAFAEYQRSLAAATEAALPEVFDALLDQKLIHSDTHRNLHENFKRNVSP